MCALVTGVQTCALPIYGSFTHTFGHIYNPADLSAFLADWNPPDRVRAQIASDDYDIGLVRGAAGALLGYIKMGPLDFELPAGQPADGAVELHQLSVAEPAKGTGVAAALMDWGIAWAGRKSSKIGRAACRDRWCQYV